MTKGGTANGDGDGSAFPCGQPLRACPQGSPRRLRRTQAIS